MAVSKKTVNVSKETYSILEAGAQARNLSIDKFVEFLVKEFRKERERAFIERLRAEGLIVSFPSSDIKAPRNFKPVPVKGKPVSETIIEDREPR